MRAAPGRMAVSEAPGADFDAAVDAAAAVIEGGGTVVLPTDTVYGLAASTRVAGATAALFALKARARSRSLAVLVADVDQGLALADLDALDAAEAARVRGWCAIHWPGALTLVLPRHASAAGVDLGGDATTIGVRCPRSRFVRALAERCGPLATTSANRSGEPTPTSADRAAESLAGIVDLVVDGGPCTDAPSTVVDVTRSPVVVRRRGSVSIDA